MKFTMELHFSCSNKKEFDARSSLSKEDFWKRTLKQNHVREKFTNAKTLRFKRGIRGEPTSQEGESIRGRKMEEDEKAKGEEAFYFLLPKFILPILKQANFRQIVNAISNANFVIFFAFL